MAILANAADRDGVRTEATEDARVLLIAGRPLGRADRAIRPVGHEQRAEIHLPADYRAGRLAARRETAVCSALAAIGTGAAVALKTAAFTLFRCDCDLRRSYIGNRRASARPRSRTLRRPAEPPRFCSPAAIMTLRRSQGTAALPKPAGIEDLRRLCGEPPPP